MQSGYDEETIIKMFHELNHFKKISSCLIQKKYGLNEHMAYEICCKIWLLRNIEARNLAKCIEV